MAAALCPCARAYQTCGVGLWVLPPGHPGAAGTLQGDVGCNLVIQMALMSRVCGEGEGMVLTGGTWGCAQPFQVPTVLATPELR